MLAADCSRGGFQPLETLDRQEWTAVYIEDDYDCETAESVMHFMIPSNCLIGRYAQLAPGIFHLGKYQVSSWMCGYGFVRGKYSGEGRNVSVRGMYGVSVQIATQDYKSLHVSCVGCDLGHLVNTQTDRQKQPVLYNTIIQLS